MSAPGPLRRALVTAAFGGLLAASWWLDGRTISGVAAAHPDALARFGFRLVESSEQAGLRFTHRQARFDPKLANVEPHLAALGASVSVADADGDGRPDVYLTSSAAGSANALFLNLGDGRFEDVAARAGLAELNVPGEGACMGSLWGDIDNDGDEDLLVYRYGQLALFRNEGGLRFTDVSAASGIRRWMNVHAATFFDYDRDGLLDLYVGGYYPETFDLFAVATTKIMHESFEFARNGGHNVLFRNRGDGSFEDVTAATGCDSTRWTMAVAAADIDLDGWQDLYLANDYGPEELFLNRGGARFELANVGLGEDSKSGMSVTLGDVRNNGRLDVFVTNISRAGFLFQGNNLRLNLLPEAGRFENVARDVVADCGWAWGAQFGDFDNDGDADLFVANGFISADRERDYWYDMSKVAGGAGDLFLDAKNWSPIGTASLSGYEPSRVLQNQGRGRFIDVAAAVGATDLYDGRAVALADLDGRGALDVLVANQGGPLLLYRSEVDPARAWIGFRLTGTVSNRSAIGAQLTLHWDGQQQSQVVASASGFSAQNDRTLHFGLGAAQAVERAVIRWPSGREQVLPAPEPRRVHAVEEPR